MEDANVPLRFLITKRF